jgi:hypothetical protein
MGVAESQWERLDVPLLEKVGELEGDVGAAVENHMVLVEALGEGWSEAMVLAAIRPARPGSLLDCHRRRQHG